MKQLTINGSVKVEGVNVYNGRKNHAIFHPAAENVGLGFIVNNNRIPAKLELAENKKKAIALTSNLQTVHLVEHLLSAVYALGIDNLDIELSDSVCPTVPNCAYEYINALALIRKEQNQDKLFWKYNMLKETKIWHYEKGKDDLLRVNGSEDFLINYAAYYPHKVIGWQEEVFVVDEYKYGIHIAKARSPAFLGNFVSSFLLLGKLGLHGINNENYLLVGPENSKKYFNPGKFGVRYGGYEFVRHKVLDVMGTLALTGRQFKETAFSFEKSGHKFDIYALKKLFDMGVFE